MASVTSSTGAVAGSSTSDVFDFETMVRSTARFQAQRALTDPIPQSHIPARVIDRLYQESFKREGARYLWTKHAYVVIATRVYANGESEKQYLMAHFDLQDANKAVRGIQELALEHVYFEEHFILDWDETTTVDTYGDSCLMMYCNDLDCEGTKVALRVQRVNLIDAPAQRTVLDETSREKLKCCIATSQHWRKQLQDR